MDKPTIIWLGIFIAGIIGVLAGGVVGFDCGFTIYRLIGSAGFFLLGASSGMGLGQILSKPTP